MKISNNLKATLAGLVVAIANAWMNVDWTNFVLEKEWPELALSGIIAIVGYYSTMNPVFKKMKEDA